MKRRRQAAILDLVDRTAPSSQEDLRRRLTALGFSVTQATLSRDLRDLGLVKASADGAYHRPGADSTPPEVAIARLQHAIAEYLTGVDRALQLVVLKTGMVVLFGPREAALRQLVGGAPSSGTPYQTGITA